MMKKRTFDENRLRIDTFDRVRIDDRVSIAQRFREPTGYDAAQLGCITCENFAPFRICNDDEEESLIIFVAASDSSW